MCPPIPPPVPPRGEAPPTPRECSSQKRARLSPQGAPPPFVSAYASTARFWLGIHAAPTPFFLNSFCACDHWFFKSPNLSQTPFINRTMRYQCSLPFALRGDFLWGCLPLYPGRFAIAIFFIDMGCTPSRFLFPHFYSLIDYLSWFLAEHKKRGEAGASPLYSSSSWVPTHADFMSL